MHVLFDETNSLVENDSQDEEYEQGLVRRDLWLTQNFMHKKGKSPEGEQSPGADAWEGGQGLDQLGGSIAEPHLEQNQLTSPQTDLRTGSITGLKTSSRRGPEPVSPSIPIRVKSKSADLLTPRPRKHQSLHPVD